MRNNIDWKGPGWYASRGEYNDGESFTRSICVSSDATLTPQEASEVARRMGFGSANWLNEVPADMNS